MVQLYNSPNITNYNAVRALSLDFGKKNKETVVLAPNYLPKYSLSNELAKRDEYRNSLKEEIRQKDKKEKIKPFLKQAGLFAFVGGVYIAIKAFAKK